MILSLTLSLIGRNLCTLVFSIAIRLSTTLYEGDFLLTAVHRDFFKVCKTSQNTPPLVSLPPKGPCASQREGASGFVSVARVHQTCTHTQKTRVETCTRARPSQTTQTSTGHRYRSVQPYPLSGSLSARTAQRVAFVRECRALADSSRSCARSWEPR